MKNADAEEKSLIIKMAEEVEKITEDALGDVLRYALDKACIEQGPIDSAFELAKDYEGKHDTIYEDVEDLIDWQVGKAASAGFLTGFLGPLSAILGIPVNLTVVAFIQLRMVAAIAHMAGYDVKDDRVKTLCLVCLCGKAISDVLKGVGVLYGQKLLVAAGRRFSGNAVERACAVVASKLLVGAGVKVGSQATKFVPFLGGVVNGAIDGALTRAIGEAARETFVGESDRNVLIRRKIII